MTTDQKKVRYDVEVIGHRAPFKWRLYRSAPGATRAMVTGTDTTGEADSLDEAAFAAGVAAERVHDEWLHANTKNSQEVFVGEPKSDAEMEAEARDRAVEAREREFDRITEAEFAGLNVAEPDRPQLHHPDPDQIYGD